MGAAQPGGHTCSATSGRSRNRGAVSFCSAVIHVEVTVIGPIEFLRLPITALLAWLIWSETTDLWTWVGAAIIITTAYGMTRHEHRVATK